MVMGHFHIPFGKASLIEDDEPHKVTLNKMANKKSMREAQFSIFHYNFLVRSSMVFQYELF